uniref:Importin subunit beta-1 n=1 Tax=Hydatigena taeniaeformis TaxID=6205 RepID=A0A0R3WYQ1_HYDTA
MAWKVVLGMAVMKTLKDDDAEDRKSRDGAEEEEGKESYAIFIYNVIRQVTLEAGILSKVMPIMNSSMNDIIMWIAAEPSRLAHYKGDRQSRAESYRLLLLLLLLPGELAKDVVSEVTKAVTKCTSSM